MNVLTLTGGTLDTVSVLDELSQYHCRLEVLHWYELIDNRIDDGLYVCHYFRQSKTRMDNEARLEVYSLIEQVISDIFQNPRIVPRNH